MVSSFSAVYSIYIKDKFQKVFKILIKTLDKYLCL